MSSLRVGFIGFGEVASVLSKPLCEGGADVRAYDVLLLKAGGQEILEGRALTKGIQFCPLAELVQDVDYVLSTATTQVASQVAQECAAGLKQSQVYVDLNSTSPAIKVEIGRIIGASGADFVEGAILGAIGATGSRTHILTGGARGEEVTERLSQLGLRLSFYSPEIGKASMFKMLRSIFAKGLEAVILELLIAGKRAGIDKDLWQDICEFMSDRPFEQIAANWVQSHGRAHERKYYEMRQVAETMRHIGVSPVMTLATEALFERSRSLGFGEAFAKKADSIDQVVSFMEERLGD